MIFQGIKDTPRKIYNILYKEKKTYNINKKEIYQEEEEDIPRKRR